MNSSLESWARHVGEELSEARAEGVDAVDGGQEGAEQRVALRGAQPVVEVDLWVRGGDGNNQGI